MKQKDIASTEPGFSGKTALLSPAPEDIARAAEILRAGGLAAVPTETVYGLAANGMDPAAVGSLCAVKGRPPEKALSLLVPGPEALDTLCVRVPPAARALAARFWPGPLTLVLPAAAGIPDRVRAGGNTVGLRCPDCAPTLALLRACGLPLAAPSANPSGAPSPVTAAEVLDYFDGKIDAVLDGGKCGLGRESTVAAPGPEGLRILRQGALPEAEIRACLLDSLTVLGVTGGSGTGKTTALGVLEEMGVPVIDADAVYHRLCDTSGAMLSEIGARFPGVVENGVLRRKALGQIVFSDENALADLRAITDRYVENEIDRLLSDRAAAGYTAAAVDAVNILDTGLARRAAAVVGITAPAEDRVARLVEREGVTPAYARLRIAAQRPDEYYHANCARVILNDGGFDEYRRRCREIFTELLEEYGHG